MRKFLLVVACVIGGLTGTVAGQAIKSEDICKQREKVAANTGYVAGCTMAFHAVHGDRSDDPLDEYWVDWCVHNAVVFAQRTESK